MKKPFRFPFHNFSRPKISSYNILYGRYAIQSLQNASLSKNLIETCRRKLRAKFNRKGRLWLRIHPDMAVSQKPTDTRMGKGKGSVKSFVALVTKGQLLFELEGILPFEAQKAHQSMQKKIGIKTRLIYDSNKDQTLYSG